MRARWWGATEGAVMGMVHEGLEPSTVTAVVRVVVVEAVEMEVVVCCSVHTGLRGGA